MTTAQFREYQRRYRAARKAKGLCGSCGLPMSEARKEAGRAWCWPCSTLSDPVAVKPYGRRKSTIV